MACASYAAQALCNPDWVLAWDDLDTAFQNALRRAGLASPLIWAGMRADRDKLTNLFCRLGLLEGDGEFVTARLAHAERLQAASKDAGDDWTSGLAAQSNYQVAVDLADFTRREKEALDRAHRDRLTARWAQRKPAEWRSRRYRRAEAEGDDNARRKAETQERERWAKKVVATLVAADLPFGRLLQEKGWDPLSPEASRCLRGLRATSLRKRISDWCPFSRWLRAHHALGFPDSKEQVLDFFAVRQEARASRSCYRSLLLALRFLEEAGEVPLPQRLSTDTALEGAAREHELRRRQLAVEAGESLGRGQAPPCWLRSWWPWRERLATKRFRSTSGPTPGTASCDTGARSVSTTETA